MKEEHGSNATLVGKLGVLTFKKAGVCQRVIGSVHMAATLNHKSSSIPQK